jgi:hypothetical protein
VCEDETTTSWSARRPRHVTTGVSHPTSTNNCSIVSRPNAQSAERVMTSDKIALVQESFQKVPTRADQAAEIFTSISLPWIPS